jgi:DNA-directed RNA polymerase subunit RPC12/RpoP
MDNSASSLLCRSESVPGRLVGGEGLSASTAGSGSVSLLASVLSYATGVAAALRERYGEMPADAEARPDRVPAGPRSAEMLPPEVSSQRTEQDADIVAFGALLYELMTGATPPRDLSQVTAPRGPRVGLEGVRTAATRLALRCLGAVGVPPDDMQQVLTEIRLYSLIARQNGRRHGTALQSAAGNASLPPCGSPSVPASVDPDPPAEDRNPAAIAQPEAQPPHPPEVDTPSKTEPSPVHAWYAAPDCWNESKPLPGVHCPACSSSFVYRSRPRTNFESLLVATGMRLNRCHRCLHRYLAFLGIVIAKKAFYRD